MHTDHVHKDRLLKDRLDNNHLAFQIQQALKRLIDLIFSGLGLIVLSPFFLLLAVAIRLDSSGPIFYRHKRVGKGGKLFHMVKFRSMRAGNDDGQYMQYLKRLIESERGGSDQSLPYRKMDTDPRITRVGRWLRTYYLDELPQLWNVFKGEMSLVGPRPHVQFEVDHYTPAQRRRLSVRPGATGLWQIKGKADCTFNEMLAMDLEYVDGWSLATDLTFIFTTLMVMLRGGERFLTNLAQRLPVKTRSAASFSPCSTGAKSEPPSLRDA